MILHWVVTPAVDISYHVQTNVSVRKGIDCATSIHSVRKGKVLFFSSVYIYTYTYSK